MSGNHETSNQLLQDAAAARLVRRVIAQWMLIVACAVVASTVGFLFASTRPNEYEATTMVQLNDIDLGSLFAAQNVQGSFQDPATKAATAAKVASLPRVATLASQKLGGRMRAEALRRATHVSSEADTTIVDITTRASDPQLAADAANAMRTAFIETRQATASAQLQSGRERLLEQISGMTPRQRESAAGQGAQARLDQLDLLILGVGAGVSTAQVATPPTSAAAPRPIRSAILALVAGGLLGLGVALLRARLDDRIRDAEELAECWDLPVLGLIPESTGLATPGPHLPDASALEAFALARTNVRYLQSGGSSMRTVVVTSALAGEGKSTVAWNLALAAGMAGQRVLLVDADLRRPTVAERLKLSNRHGLSEYLAGMASVEEVVRPVRVPVPGGADITVSVTPSGFLPASPIAVIERPGTREAFRALAVGYDLVIVDTPPGTVVADAKVLMAYADAAIVVSRLGRVTHSSIERLRALLSDLDTPVLGTIINGGVAAESYGYSSYEPIGGPAPLDPELKNIPPRRPGRSAGDAAPRSGAGRNVAELADGPRGDLVDVRFREPEQTGDLGS